MIISFFFVDLIRDMKRRISENGDQLDQKNVPKNISNIRKLMLHSLFTISRVWISDISDDIFSSKMIVVVFRLMWNGIWKNIGVTIHNIATITRNKMIDKSIPKHSPLSCLSDTTMGNDNTISNMIDEFSYLSFPRTKLILETKGVLVGIIIDQLSVTLSNLFDLQTIKGLFYDIPVTKINEIEIHFGGIYVSKSCLSNKLDGFSNDNQTIMPESQTFADFLDLNTDGISFRQNVLDFDFGKGTELFSLMSSSLSIVPEDPMVYNMFTSALFSVSSYCHLKITSWSSRYQKSKSNMLCNLHSGCSAKQVDYENTDKANSMDSIHFKNIDQIFFSGSKGIHVWLDDHFTNSFNISDHIKNLYVTQNTSLLIRDTVNLLKECYGILSPCKNEHQNFFPEINFVKFMVNQMHNFGFYKKLTNELVIKFHFVNIIDDIEPLIIKRVVHQNSSFEDLLNYYVYENYLNINKNTTSLKVIPKFCEKKTVSVTNDQQSQCQGIYSFSDFVMLNTEPIIDTETENFLISRKIFPTLNPKEIITRFAAFFIFFNPLTCLDFKVNQPKSIIRAPFSINSKTMVRSFNLDLDTISGSHNSNFELTESFFSFESMVLKNKN